MIGKVIEINSECTECRVTFLQKDIKVSEGDRKYQTPYPDSDFIPIFPIFESAAFEIYAPIEVGDKVEITVSERSLFEAITGDELSEQFSSSKFNLADSYIARPIPNNITSKTNSDKDSFYIKDKTSGSFIKISKDGNIIINGKSITINCDSLVVNAPTTTFNTDSFIVNSSTMDINATLSINGKPYDSHAHSGVQSGGSNTGGVV